MPKPPPFFRRLLAVTTDARFKNDVVESLQEEFEGRVEAEGEKAAGRWYRKQVLRSLGPLLWWRLFKQDAPWCRAGRRLVWSGPGQDMKFALRSLLGSPGFSLVVILTFALGIGVNMAVFSLVHSLILEPLSFPGGNRMVQLWRYEEFDGRQRALVAPASPMVAAWKAEEGLFDDMGAYTEEEFHITEPEGVSSVRGARVSPEILSMVAATPLLGRIFGAEDVRPGPGRVTLLSQDLWVRRFGSDPTVVGRILQVDGNPHTIVGILPREIRGVLEGGFFGSEPKEILLPLRVDGDRVWPNGANVVARLEPGLPLETAQDRLNQIQARVASLLEGENEWFALAVPARETLGLGFRRGLWVIFGAVGVVLLIACANIATLLLVRRLARDEEMRVRLALGAGRLRLAGQLLTECLLLGVTGMTLAILTARWLVDGTRWIAGGALPEVRGARLEVEALVFGLGAGLLTVAAFSLIPILQLSFISPAGAVTRERPREVRRPVGWAAHKSLVVGQVALATVLILAAGLLSNSLSRLLAVDPGFNTEGLAAVGLELPRDRYGVGTERIAFFDAVVAGLEESPGVESAGWARFVPPRVAGAPGMVNVEGRPPPDERTMEGHAGNWVAPSYFRAIGTPFLEGRPFTQSEIDDGTEVVILNRSGAQRLWPEGGGGVGTRIQLDSDYGPSPWMTVVGIVPDFKAWWLGDRPDRIQIYLPSSNVPPRSGIILVRGEGELGEVASRVQAQVRRLDASLPIGESFWVGDAFRQSVARQRFETVLLSSFGLMGLMLAILGVYGVLSLSVTRRTREFGVRLALGATRRDVIQRVMGQGLRAVVAGTGLGLVLSYISAGLLATLLWGIEATDLPTYLVCSGGTVLAGLAATYLSTRRVTAIDPTRALRRE